MRWFFFWIVRINYELLVGEKITFELPEITNTGYSWIVSENRHNITELVGEEREEWIKSDANVLGSESIVRFVFEAKQRGISKIVFELRRSWEEAPCPVARFFVFINVQE